VAEEHEKRDGITKDSLEKTFTGKKVENTDEKKIHTNNS